MGCDKPPHERNWRLYALLDLIYPVTSKQVKWNFRKVTLRHHYYQAYLVLYNKSRKYLYDAVGEEAYGFIESGTWGPLVPVLGSLGSIIFYCLLMLIQMALLILFFAFLGARVDEVITWGWERVIAPLMAFACLMLITTFFAMLVNFISPRTRREGMAAVDRVAPIGNFLASAAYFCIPFVIGSAVRGDSHAKDGYYLKYMCLPIIGDVLYYLTSLIWRWPQRLRLQMTVDANRPSPVISYGIFLMAFANMGCGVAQWVMIGKKIDKTTNVTWYVAFIPLAVRAGVRVVEACLRSLMKYTIGVRSQVGVAFDTLGSFFSNGILITSLYFVAVRIERGKEKVRMAHALIPVYVTLAYIFLCLIITFVVLLVKRGRLAREESRGNHLWTPPPERAETSDSTNNGPIATVGKSDAWEAVDAGTATSSAAFPEEGPYEEDEYDDFYSDEEDEPFAEADDEVYSRQQPYGSPRDDEVYSEATTESPRETPNEHHERVVESRPTVLHDARATDEAVTNGSEGTGSYEEEDEEEVSEESERLSDEETAETGGTPERHEASSVSDDAEMDNYTEVTTYLDEEEESEGYSEESYTDESATPMSSSASSSAAFSSSSRTSQASQSAL